MKQKTTQSTKPADISQSLSSNLKPPQKPIQPTQNPINQPPENIDYQEEEPQVDEDQEQAYNYDSEDQGIQDYKIGGYHPVHIGQVIMNRYVVIQKLGWGHFSTVWLAKDFKYNNYVALKIQKSAPHYLEAAYDQVEILQRVEKCMGDPQWHNSLRKYYADENRKSFTRDDTHVISLLNSFIYRGPYGNHFCFVFEILGVNLYQIVKRYNYKGVPLHLCRKIAKQVLIGLDFLHRFCGVIHTDLKPENVLLCLSQAEITQIVQNGRLNQTKAYQQRIRQYQQAFGVKIDPQQKLVESRKKQELQKNEDKIIEEDNKKREEALGIRRIDSMKQDNIKNQQIQQIQKKLEQKSKLTKTQKKNLKKKLKKLKQTNPIQLNGKKQQIQQPKQQQSIPSIRLQQQASNNPNEQQTSNPLKPINLNIDFKKSNQRGPKLAQDFKVKIADLGNACWTHHHFATQIQTRQYRSPQTILGIKYDTSADIWSFACMIYQMLTGQLMFQPTHGRDFRKNQHHLALMQERIGKFPRNFKMAGKKSKHYFDRDGQLKHFKDIQYVSFADVLPHKIRMKVQDAKQFQQFVLPLLNPFPNLRMKAHKALQSHWLRKGKNNYKMTELQYQKFMAESEDPFKDNYSQNEESFDADKSEGNNEQQDDEDFYGQKGPISIKLVDESFSKFGYIGYCDGLNLHQLDQIPNWQFS